MLNSMAKIIGQNSRSQEPAERPDDRKVCGTEKEAEDRKE